MLDDDLFLERLETFFDKSLADLQGFSERESRPFDEVRKRIAQWHCRYLFSTPQDEANSSTAERIFNVLRTTSDTLESLHEIAGLHSFFLVVNPNDPADEGFLGGTVRGREFWRGHRGCGVSGAKTFKAQCIKSEDLAQSAAVPSGPPIGDASVPPTSALPKKGPASSLKAEIYSSVRGALRAASGVRTAEMKWTDHSRLSGYGIRLVGWPDGVPLQNPSTLSVAQNRTVLGELKKGTLRFVRLDGSQGAHTASGSQLPSAMSSGDDAAVDFSWACEEQLDPPESSPNAEAAAVSNPSHLDVEMTPSPPTTSVTHDPFRPYVHPPEGSRYGRSEEPETRLKKRPRED